MAKIKVKDKEVEVDDEVASLVADETGVPFRNRAAEARRKQEKYEKELEELRTWKTEQEAKAKPAPASQPLYTPGVYTSPQGQQYVQPQQQFNPYATYQQPAFTEEQARRIAQEEYRREQDRREYEEEQNKLKQDWPDYEDEKDRVKDYLVSKGYSDEQINSFGPRDIRLVRDAYTGAVKTQRANKRSPQEVVLDTGGGDGIVDDLGAPTFKEGDFAKMDKKDFHKLVAETRMKARIGDE